MKRITLIIATLALVAAACGTGDVGDAGPVTLPPTSTEATTTSTSTTTTVPGSQPTVPTTQAPPDVVPGEPADLVFIEVFFVKDGSWAQSVVRAVETPSVGANAIRALLQGPTPAEQDAGLYSSIPSNTLFLGLNISEGLATVDLSREFEVGGGSSNILSRLAQVVYTLTQFPTVDRVLFHLDGEPVDVFSGEGVVLEEPVDRSSYATILPIGAGPDVAAGEPWSQADLPDVAGLDPAELSRVTLVAVDDVLNVRQDPGVGSPIVGMLLPGVVVERTGREATSGSSTWVQISTPAGDYWVNGWFLAAAVPPADFVADSAVGDLLDEFAAIIAADGDLSAVTSRRGLYVSHNADPVRFTPEQLATILKSDTTYKWPSNALGPDELDEIPARTFAAAIADSFLSAYDDPDTVITMNQPIAGGNGRLPEYAIPYQLAFNYVGVHDPGDNPEYEGLDWTTWYVSIDYEDGSPVIVGLTVDMWAP